MSTERPTGLLVLGGSSEASALARQLGTWSDVALTYSLAGRTAVPHAPSGTLRIGGFGGVEGLIGWLETHGVGAVVDATHPFTAQMPWNVARACESLELPRLRLRRPGWVPEAGDKWTVAADMDTAVRILEGWRSRRVFLATGRQQLTPFARLEDTWFLVRSIEAPDPMPLARAEVVLERGPFELGRERRLMASTRVDALVTKNSGGSAAASKLVAARELGVRVVMVARPPEPEGPRVATVAEAVDWCAAVLGRGHRTVESPEG